MSFWKEKKWKMNAFRTIILKNSNSGKWERKVPKKIMVFVLRKNIFFLRFKINIKFRCREKKTRESKAGEKCKKKSFVFLWNYYDFFLKNLTPLNPIISEEWITKKFGEAFFMRKKMEAKLTPFGLTLRKKTARGFFPLCYLKNSKIL